MSSIPSSNPSSPSTSASARSTARHAAVAALQCSGMLALARHRVARIGVVVLTFHRIVPDAAYAVCRSPQGMVMRESVFTALLAWLMRKADPLSPHALEQRSEPGDRPKVLLTFDDGWLDNLTIAWPHLRHFGLDACIFVTTGLLGRSQPFWPERFLALHEAAAAAGHVRLLQEGLAALSASADATTPKQVAPDAGTSSSEKLLSWLKLFPAQTLEIWLERMHASISTGTASLSDPLEKLLAWSDLHTLASQGARIGSHSVSHAILPQLSPPDLHNELHHSRAALEQHAAASDWISYPDGQVTLPVLQAARSAGYQYGFTTSPGIWGPDTDPLRIPRINLWDGTVLDAHGRFSAAHADYALFCKTLFCKPLLRAAFSHSSVPSLREPA